jgi:hypothetical protein
MNFSNDDTMFITQIKWKMWPKKIWHHNIFKIKNENYHEEFKNKMHWNFLKTWNFDFLNL